MPMLEHDNVFTMHVPDGWTATFDGGTYELLPPDGEGAVHVSAYERQPAPLTQAEAREAINLFLGNLEPLGDVDVRVLAESADQHRAVARFTASDADSGTTHDWLVFAVLWPRALVMCSATAPAGSELTSSAESMFAAIAPAARRRRLFRR